jgi:eukaryotic translation initiation factor 2C
MRAITHQPASDLRFSLTGKDGKPDKMVTVVDYFKRE